jgi:hypothetical protein
MVVLLRLIGHSEAEIKEAVLQFFQYQEWIKGANNPDSGDNTDSMDPFRV